MLTRLALLPLLGVAVVLAYGQAPPQPTAPNTAPVATPSEGEAAPAPVTEVTPAEPGKPRGDILTLKSGQRIEGLQILRQTAADYVLEVIPGINLNIPRRQVVSVDPDDYDPALARSKAKQALIQGQRVSDTLQNKLDIDISTPALNVEKMDLVKVLDEINKRVGDVLVVDPSVEQVPAESRLWTLQVEPGTTLGVLLRKELLVTFPDLVLVFQGDKVILKTKVAAAEPPKPEGGPAPSPPPAGEPAAQPSPPATPPEPARGP